MRMHVKFSTFTGKKKSQCEDGNIGYFLKLFSMSTLYLMWIIIKAGQTEHSIHTNMTCTTKGLNAA